MKWNTDRLESGHIGERPFAKKLFGKSSHVQIFLFNALSKQNALRYLKCL
ncbi:DEHA2C12188p [Debaryomyces hansenii CBS767]|uniref:DEHA2C12188p n=1 Tax=Debaryomyces hansenii (strain ATCC 36239 / CBS 767 / BCRC 21394 / JCM 1990 / NBRC 0083 / IGC 2968) TaxID=284592 RepID=B5RTA5_DEBHA|nr:DEHA2C12188p [Debaryomyces hansenii CBS767]CAR65564.1 DEHA2C12188p [Debaryomyces hansenii CBS767]|eukprot:XP_002770201.1 DEHA2C12188p [Debaryomyces hansenii CBS767]